MKSEISLVIEKDMKSLRAIQKEHQNHIEALRNGDDFTPVLTGSRKPSTPKKRKNRRKGKKGSSKRRRSSVSSDDEDESDGSDDSSSESAVEDDEDELDSSSDDSDDSDDESSDSQLSPKYHKHSGHSDMEVEGLLEEQVTEESVQERLEQTQANIRAARGRLSEARKDKKIAIDHLASLKKSLSKVQKAKNGFCSLKRSDYSRDVLKEDFRTGGLLRCLFAIRMLNLILYHCTGLKNLDDEVAEERDPLNFDSSVNQRGMSRAERRFCMLIQLDNL